jgi:hypothetical protein
MELPPLTGSLRITFPQEASKPPSLLSQGRSFVRICLIVYHLTKFGTMPSRRHLLAKNASTSPQSHRTEPKSARAIHEDPLKANFS